MEDRALIESEVEEEWKQIPGRLGKLGGSSVMCSMSPEATVEAGIVVQK